MFKLEVLLPIKYQLLISKADLVKTILISSVILLSFSVQAKVRKCRKLEKKEIKTSHEKLWYRADVKKQEEKRV